MAGECSNEPMNVYTRTGGLYTYTTTCTIVVRLHTTPHSSLMARTATSPRYDHPPSSDRCKSPIGPPDVSVDAPTIPKNRSEPPKIRPFSPITPETPTRNPPSERQPLPHSPHPHTAPHRRRLLHLAQRRSAPGGDLGSYRVHAIQGRTRRIRFKRDGYDDGEELTRARVKD